VILAGGVGSRFWPLSTRERPKQLLPLVSERPLIADTVARARSLVPDARLRILAGAHLVAPFRRVLPDIPERCYLVEPEARGTCPVLAWAAREILLHDPEAVMVSLHADHLIRPARKFLETIASAVETARRHEMLVTVGVTPDRIETGFGHIQPGEALDETPAAPRRVAAFHEKPDAPTARRYMGQGYLWNTGIFVWQAETFLDEISGHAPEITHALSAATTPPQDDAGRAPPGHEGRATADATAFFREVPPCTVDEAVLERSRRVAVVRADFEWDDVGSFEALTRTRATDAGVM